MVHKLSYYYEDTNEWKVFNVDAWGNAEDGWDMNDFWEIARVTFTDAEYRYDYKIIDKLVDMEILKPEARDLAYLDSDYGCMIVRDKDTDEPLLYLEMIRIFHNVER